MARLRSPLRDLASGEWLETTRISAYGNPWGAALARGASMAQKTLAIIGSGPSGLAVGKAAIECGLKPAIFDGKPGVGGLWRPAEGHVWKDMHTNLSKWTCAFSDFPWPPEANEFPGIGEINSYLNNYAALFRVTDAVHPNCQILRTDVLDKGWRLILQQDAREKVLNFDYLVVASGVFCSRFIPMFPGINDFKGRQIHSSEYNDGSVYTGERVSVIGASFSGIEIASHLAEHGAYVDLIFRNPTWIIPRYGKSSFGPDKVPIDLIFYSRVASYAAAKLDADRNLNLANYFKETFGNPGDFHPALRVKADSSPPRVAISDSFLDHVSRGRINPHRGEIENFEANAIKLVGGQKIPSENIVFCTGYLCDLSFLPPSILEIIEYDPLDKLVPFIAHRTVFHPKISRLAFVGLYRGPYFATIEAQARWACMTFGGHVPLPEARAMQEGLAAELKIRAAEPRPQFPHPNYVAFSDQIAAETGSLPLGEGGTLGRAVAEGPFIGAHYRLQGYAAAREIALSTIKEVCGRVGFNWQ